MTTPTMTKRCFRSKAFSQPRYVDIGLPVKRGTFSSSDRLSLVSINSEEENLPSDSQLEVLTSWPDGSPKWINIRSVIEGDKDFFISNKKFKNKHKKPTTTGFVSLTESNVIDFSEFKFLLNVKLKNEHKLDLLPIENKIKQCDLDDRIMYRFASPEVNELNFTLSIVYSKATAEYFAELRIENTNKAIHPSGTWDLGDPNSIEFEFVELNVRLNSATNIKLHLLNGMDTSSHDIHDNAINLTQMNSGGDNCNSPIHLNKDGNVHHSGEGFTLSSGEDILCNGTRANPCVTLTQNRQNYSIRPINFWQNFPAKIHIDKHHIAFKFLINAAELQPGESKSFSINISKTNTDDLKTERLDDLRVQFDANYLNDSNCLRFTELNKTNTLTKLTDKGIKGKDSFLNKREVVDVYGWRNFGELYADHEALNQPTDSFFISHYNNQYDPLMGMLIQHLSAPNEGWDKVANPLAKHISDIDIYNTKLDKPEYNGGLFWHTDHYLPAETCTHRTYSKLHHSVYDGHQGGGGPGGQHCYTTGLMLHGLLNNDEVAKLKVIQLSAWIRSYYSGNGSILDRIFRFLTIDLKPEKPTSIGIIKKGFRFPLDRGTGNYLTSLIDCYEITQNSNLLLEMAYILKGTVGTGEDIGERNLSDTENTWFYTIFLQAVIKYLLLKESLEQLDADYYYALQVFEEYSQWMLRYEAPYLDNPTILEFPNDTWAAQDIRKAVIFAYSAYFFVDDSDSYLEKSTFFLNYVITKLESSPEANTTRILAILLQNSGAIEKARSKTADSINKRSIANYTGQPALIRLFLDLAKLITKFSIKREINWLSIRFTHKKIFKGDFTID